MTALTMTEMFEFERQWWVYAGDKATAVRARFGIALDAYHRALDQVIATDTAMAHDPMLVKRLRRLANQRHRQKARR